MNDSLVQFYVNEHKLTIHTYFKAGIAYMLTLSMNTVQY